MMALAGDASGGFGNFSNLTWVEFVFDVDVTMDVETLITESAFTFKVVNASSFHFLFCRYLRSM